MTELIKTDVVILMCAYYARYMGKYPEVLYISDSLHVPDELEDWLKRAGIRIDRSGTPAYCTDSQALKMFLG